MESPLKTSRERWLAVALLALWVCLYLPHLRTSPNWYGDEGEWMEKCWTFIHGTPRVGPIINDFIFPYPYPPLYMLLNGTLLRVFGNDIAVARALGSVTALAAAAILFWIGTRLRDKNFGFLCAAALLVYSEANVNFRWVRSHPMAGTFALASVGFLIRCVQERRLRDAIGAGLMCALATATNYFTYPLVVAVVVTVAVVNPVAAKTPLRQTLWPRARRVLVAGVVAGSYIGLFVCWYALSREHGWSQLMTQAGRLTSVAANETRPTLWGELARFCGNVWALGFKTPTHGPPPAWSGHDWWLTIATAGFVFLPTRDWKLRLWVPFWLLVLMYGVFKKLNNVPLFFYPATIFLPLMAVGFAGVLAWGGELSRKAVPQLAGVLPAAIAAIGLACFGLPTLNGAWPHFDTKIDMWTQQSAREAGEAMEYVNARCSPDDFVIVPKQIYWLARTTRRSMLTYCARYGGVVNDMPVPVLIPRELYWFDCRLEQAKYLVLASGVTQTGQPRGIDLIYTRSLVGVQDVIDRLVQERWQVVFAGKHPHEHQVALVNVGGGKQWPVAVDGEYLVLANPVFVKADQQ